MNLALHTIEANLGTQPADTFLRDLHPDLKADYILADPPFNVSDWSGQLLENDVRWRFGKPPKRQRQLRVDSAFHPPPGCAQRPRRRYGLSSGQFFLLRALILSRSACSVVLSIVV